MLSFKTFFLSFTTVIVSAVTSPQSRKTPGTSVLIRTTAGLELVVVEFLSGSYIQCCDIIILCAFCVHCETIYKYAEKRNTVLSYLQNLLDLNMFQHQFFVTACTCTSTSVGNEVERTCLSLCMHSSHTCTGLQSIMCTYIIIPCTYYINLSKSSDYMYYKSEWKILWIKRDIIGIVEKVQETSFHTGMHVSMHMCHWCTIYMKSRCGLECRDTPTSWSHCVTSISTLMVTIWSLCPSLYRMCSYHSDIFTDVGVFSLQILASLFE